MKLTEVVLKLLVGLDEEIVEEKARRGMLNRGCGGGSLRSRLAVVTASQDHVTRQVYCTKVGTAGREVKVSFDALVVQAIEAAPSGAINLA